MTEFILGLIPDYGLYIIFFTVVLACLAAPLPASVLVLAAGGFVATGDLILWQVVATTFLAFLIGDQLAFQVSRLAGPPILERFQNSARMASLIQRSAKLLRRRGPLAVFLSHTIFSPMCAYVSYLSGAGGLSWRAYSASAFLGAGLWTAAYVAIGYVFSGQLTQVADISGNALGFIMAIAVLGLSGMWLARQWRRSHKNA